jgi:hypothetical protein
MIARLGAALFWAFAALTLLVLWPTVEGGIPLDLGLIVAGALLSIGVGCRYVLRG